MILHTKMENLKAWRDNLRTFKDCKISSKLEDIMIDVIDVLEHLLREQKDKVKCQT